MAFDDVKLETSRVLGMSQTNSNDAVVEMLVSPDVNTIQRPTKDPSVAGQPGSLGSAASHGCVRMSEGDVIDLYDRVEVGTPVYIG